MICVVFAAALALTFVVSQTLLMKRFAQLENENTDGNVERAVSALYTDFDSMNITFSSVSFDTGSFSWVQDENGMHMEIRMDGPSFVVMGINYIIYVIPACPLRA